MEPIALLNCCLPPEEDKLLGPPQGSLCLAADLCNNGRSVSIYDTSLDLKPSDFTPDILYEYLLDIQERIICISIWDSVVPKVILATKKLKFEEPDKIVIIGGPAASTNGTTIVENFPWIDFAVKGEGETVLNNLLVWIESNDNDINALSNKITGRHGDKTFIGQKIIAPLLEENIPIPDYSFVKDKNYTKAEILTTRGCPYQCSFCSVNSAWGKGIRFKPLKHIFKEIYRIIEYRDLGCIHILDDNFGTNKIRLNNFCNHFRSHYPQKEWSCYFRISDMDKNTVEMMANSGCFGVYTGIESGNNKKLKELGKGIDKNEIVERIKFASSCMNITASFIWGFPGTSNEGFLQTIRLIDRILDFENVFVNLYQLAPLSGTKILNEFNNNLVFDENYISGFIYPPFLSKLTDEEKLLISKYPSIFSAFYHEDSIEFKNNFFAVKKFLCE